MPIWQKVILLVVVFVCMAAWNLYVILYANREARTILKEEEKQFDEADHPNPEKEQ